MAQTHPIDSLPNEILINILELFPTRELLPLSALCHRFQALVSRVYYGRLLDAVALVEHEIILECYHPSAKISTPYMFCDYLGTDGLEDAASSLVPSIRALNEMYSRFRPVLKEEDRRPRARYPTMASSSSGVGGSGGAEQRKGEAATTEVELPSQDVHLDSCELFSQLCTVANLVKVGPRRGLFLSHVNISDGVVRVWRDWLAGEAAKTQAAKESQCASLGMFESSILWADPSMNIGLKLRITEKQGMQAAVLIGADDEPPISYAVDFEELLVRSNQLILGKEQAATQQFTQSGKAIIIATV